MFVGNGAMAAMDFPHPSGQRDERKLSEDPMVFDLVAQPLVSALERYSAISGFQVIYDGTLVLGLRSAAVKGIFTPKAALQMLLEGTGLSPRYMAADGFMLLRSPPGDGGAPKSVGPHHATARCALLRADSVPARKCLLCR